MLPVLSWLVTQHGSGFSQFHGRCQDSDEKSSTRLGGEVLLAWLAAGHLDPDRYIRVRAKHACPKSHSAPIDRVLMLRSLEYAAASSSMLPW